MSELTRRASFVLGLGVAAAGPAVLGANLVAAGVALGPAYPWRFLTWGRRENTVNDAYFPRRAVPAAARAAPLAQALDPARVERALGMGPLAAFMARTATTAFVVARDDRVVFEGYGGGGSRATLQGSRSMAKSVLGLLTGVAIAEGRISGVDAPMEALLPEVAGLRGSGVTLLHMLQMGGGLRYRGDGTPLGVFTAEALWDGTRIAYFVAALRRYLATARAGTAPGTRFVYDDRGAQLVGLALERAFGMPVSQALSERVWGPMGAEFGASWALNSVADGLEKLEGGLYAAAVDWLKLGQVVLHEGGGVASAGWVAAMTSAAVVPGGYYEGFEEFRQQAGLGYGRFWWSFPEGECFMHGLYGQVVYVCRRHRTVVVRTGSDYGGVGHWPALIRGFCGALAQG